MTNDTHTTSTGTAASARPDVSVPKTVAAALASVISAVVASGLGVAGTLIGAAVGAVVATVGGSYVTWSLERGQERIRTTARQAAAQRGAAHAPTSVDVAEAAAQTTPLSAQQDDAPGPATAMVTAEETGDGRWHPRWKRIAIGAALVFGIAMGAIFVFELATGRSLSAEIRGDQGTTAPTIFGGGGSAPVEEEPQPQPTQTQDSGEEEGDSTPTSSPSASPTSSPTRSPTSSPTATSNATPNQQATSPAPDEPDGGG
jgi:hypothetical protein